MTMAQVVQSIKSQSTIGTKVFLYVVDNEVASYTEAPILNKVSSESWYLYPLGASGTPVPSAFPGATEVNNTLFCPQDSSGKIWIDWLADFRLATYVSADSMDGPDPFLDGFFMDNFSWTPTVDGDYNRDGTTDSRNDPIVQGWYRAGYQHYLQYIRSKWPGSTQVGNLANWGQSQATLGAYDQLLEGGVLEGYFGDTWSFETWGGFAVMMAAYRKTMDALLPPKLGIVGDDDPATDYQAMRYGLAATTMDDGYFYKSNAGSYSLPLLWYDEYDFNLGYPVAGPPGARQSAAWQQGVWRRDFDHGIALVNPKGNGAQTVTLGGTFHKLTGTQDPAVNDGSAVTQVTLQDRDGLFLSR
jgi:hypothetical protein